MLKQLWHVVMHYAQVALIFEYICSPCFKHWHVPFQCLFVRLSTTVQRLMYLGTHRAHLDLPKLCEPSPVVVPPLSRSNHLFIALLASHSNVTSLLIQTSLFTSHISAFFHMSPRMNILMRSLLHLFWPADMRDSVGMFLLKEMIVIP